MPQKVGLIGWPVKHSISPPMHNAAFKALNLDWEYDVMAIPPDIMSLGLREPMQHGYIGMNVTVPHKEEAMRFVKPDELARAVGAVNTIDFRDMTATNTDVIGLIDDLKAFDVQIADQDVLVLGAGGAARAAVYGLRREGARVTVVNRTLKKAQMMLADLTLSAGMRDIEVKTLDAAVDNKIDVIINCTSAGLWPNVDASPWIEGVPFPEGVTVYDMIYRPENTALMKLAEQNGGRGISGLGMLIRQGAASFKIWTDIDPPLDVMFDAAREALRGG